MRRLNAAFTLAVALALIIAGGCRRGSKVSVETVEEGSQELASMIHVADPRTSIQLLRGFHDVEQNAWRWTLSKFSVTLRPPAGAVGKGALLQLKLSIPDAVIAKVGPVTLSAAIGASSLEPQSFAKAGEHLYSREVPSEVFTGEAVTVDFALDKFLAAGTVEQRELGIVVTMVGLLAK